MLKSFRIDKSNRAFFRTYMPPDIYAKMDRQNVLTIGAAEDTTAIGVMVVEVVKDIVNILWLYVTITNRRRGVATMLLTDLEKAARAEKTIEIQTAFSELDDAQGMTGLLNKCGYICHQNYDKGIISFKVSALNWDLFKTVKNNSHVISWNDAPDIYVKAYIHKIQDSHLAMSELSYSKAAYLSCSTAILKDREIAGVCLLRGIDSQIVELCLFRAQTEVANLLGTMLKTSLETLNSDSHVDTTIYMASAGQSGFSLFERLSAKTSRLNIFTGMKFLKD